MKKAFLAITYPTNKKKVGNIKAAIKTAGLNVKCFATDYKKDGQVPLNKLMHDAFKWMDSCDLIIVDISKISLGIGIESGYAYIKKIPLVAIHEKGTKTSNSMIGIADLIFEYKKYSDITKKISEYLKSH